MTIIDNVYSPLAEDPDSAEFEFEDTDEEERLVPVPESESDADKYIKKLNKIATPQKIAQAHRRATGGFAYKSVGKVQEYSVTIRDGWDIILISSILLNKKIDISKLPVGYSRTYLLFQNAGYPLENQFIFKFESELKNWLQTPTTSNNINFVTNPITKRKIKVAGATFKKIFKGIKLKSVTYKTPNHFNIKEYIVNEFCVPSFFSEALPKKYFKQLDFTNNTPTYPELTNMLNKINYGLDVYIIDGFKLQEQDYKKKFKILIHDSHMYVTKGKSPFKKVKCEEVTLDKLYELTTDNLSYFKSNEVILDNTKYILEKRFKKINDTYDFMGTFSQMNTKFFDNCGIRASRYYSKDHIYTNGFDINQCYPNIIKNKNYIFAVQNGSEETKLYSGTIHAYGFYYCEFKKMNEIDSVLFNKKCWIFGYLIKNLKLNVKIIYEHVSNNFTYGSDCEADKLLMTHYSGTLATYTKEECHYYNTTDEDEQLALKLKYDDDSCYSNYGISIKYTKFKKKAGLYAYLSIISYSKYQLYKIYQALDNVKVKKVYTDSISFNRKLTNKDKLSVNKKLKDFSVKIEIKKSDFENVISQITYTGYTPKQLNYYTRSDVIDLIKDNKSFCMNGKGGYGKTYLMKNIILPYFKENNIKYVVTSTTILNASLIGGLPIQSILNKKTASFNNLINYFKDIDYIIVEEVSQLTVDLINYLSFLKEESFNIICIGDINQCTSVDTNKSWIGTKCFYDLNDYNFIKFEWQPFCRYTKEHDNFLEQLINLFDKQTVRSVINKYIVNYFKKQGLNTKKHEDLNKIILTWSHKKGKEITKITNVEYSTVHKKQGETINTNYSIYEWDRMPKDVLYTALSRATEKELITLCY